MSQTDRRGNHHYEIASSLIILLLAMTLRDRYANTVTVQDFPKSVSSSRVAGWIRRLAEEAMTSGSWTPQEIEAISGTREQLPNTPIDKSFLKMFKYY